MRLLFKNLIIIEPGPGRNGHGFASRINPIMRRLQCEGICYKLSGITVDATGENGLSAGTGAQSFLIHLSTVLREAKQDGKH
jgi:hypothetical protein